MNIQYLKFGLWCLVMIATLLYCWMSTQVLPRAQTLARVNIKSGLLCANKTVLAQMFTKSIYQRSRGHSL